MNHNLRVDKAISKDPNTIQRWQLNQYLRTQRGASMPERLLHSVIEACLDAEHSKDVLNNVFNALPSESMSNVIQELGMLRTWDRVKLHGGRILQGDAIDLLTRDQTINMNIFPTASRIKFKWARGAIYSFIKVVLLGFAPGRLTNKQLPKCKLYPNYGKFNFHAAGDKQPLQLDIKRIDWISIG